MTTPATRTPVRIARGSFASLSGSIVDLQPGEIVYAVDENLLYVVESGVLTPQAYVSSGTLTSTLSGYVTTGNLTTTLSGYVTTGNLTTTLSGYATTGSLASYANLSGATFTGQIATRTIDVNSGAYQQTIVSVGTGTSFNCSSGNYFTSTVSGTPTYTVTGVPSGRSYAFVIEVLYSGGTITWFSGVEWPGGVAPSLTTDKTNLFIFHTDNQGSRWRGSYLVNYTT